MKAWRWVLLLVLAGAIILFATWWAAHRQQANSVLASPSMDAMQGAIDELLDTICAQDEQARALFKASTRKRQEPKGRCATAWCGDDEPPAGCPYGVNVVGEETKDLGDALDQVVEEKRIRDEVTEQIKDEQELLEAAEQLKDVTEEAAGASD